jgi:hypothetical protein
MGLKRGMETGALTPHAIAIITAALTGYLYLQE